MTRSHSPGFTLLELMLSLSLLAIILVIIYASNHAVALSKLQGEARMNSDQEARTLIWMLSRELRGTVFTPLIPSHVLLIGEASRAAGQPLDTITFSTLDAGHHRALESFGPEELVSYTTAPNPQNRGSSMLLRSESSALLQGNVTSNSPPTVIATNVISLHIRYLFNGQWLESWDSTTAPPGQNLPQAISIELTLAAGRRPTYLSTIVPIPMAFSAR